MHVQAVLGHTAVKVTEIYPKILFEKAAKVMGEIGRKIAIDTRREKSTRNP